MTRTTPPAPLSRLLLAAALLATVGCGSSQPERRQDAPPRSAQSSAITLGALAGSWRAGQEHLLLTMDGVYTWERVLACDVPPCPVNQTSGTFELQGTTLTLATLDAKGHPLALKLASDPRRLTIRSEQLGQSWTLEFQD